MALVCFPCVGEFHFSLLCGLSIESGDLYLNTKLIASFTAVNLSK